MPTYRLLTLGCKVNHYESMQVQELLRDRGYTPVQDGQADLVIVNTCSVTAAAAAKSRSLLRKSLRKNGQTIAIGCYATSHPRIVQEIVGPDAVISHQDDVAQRLTLMLPRLQFENFSPISPAVTPQLPSPLPPPPGTATLPPLSEHQSTNQRAILKIQDGCDAHCTYCIIPKLRPVLFSRPIDQVISEARRLVAAGHKEIVLTGVFLGAFGHSTALHRRQHPTSDDLAALIRRLGTDVPDLLRLRLSSLEPGDLTPSLIDVLAAHPQVMPHFHLPLQSGSDVILRRMNRQYTSSEYLQMIHRLNEAFDRPAITTDIIVGFPGESADDFARTLDLTTQSKFLHIHAFPFSPRENTAAARWKNLFVPQRIATERMHALTELATRLSTEYRQQFIRQEMKILVEHPGSSDCDFAGSDHSTSSTRHGRCERYFSIHVDAPSARTGDLLSVRLDRVNPHRTLGSALCAHNPKDITP